jgi:pentatricopeptide repeat protein
MILGHVKCGQGQNVIKLFQQMQKEDVRSRLCYICGGVECMCQHGGD